MGPDKQLGWKEQDDPERRRVVAKELNLQQLIGMMSTSPMGSALGGSQRSPVTSTTLVRQEAA